MEFVISASGLSRRYGSRLVVDGLDLRVRSQSITGFLGPNGAGKTTTISLLLGLLKADAGTAEVLGLPPGHPAALAFAGAGVGGDTAPGQPGRAVPVGLVRDAQRGLHHQHPAAPAPAFGANTCAIL